MGVEKAMANEQQVNQLKQKIDGALAYQGKDLITRSEWGSITFKNSIRHVYRLLPFRQQGFGMGAIGKRVGLSSRTVWRFLRTKAAPSCVK